MTAVKRLVALVVLAGLCYAGWWGYHAYLAEKGEALEASGTVEATTVQLSARAPGTLETLAAREGDSVRRGQVLATLTRNDLVAQRERDAMALLKAEAQLNDLLSGARAQEIKNAEANLEMARLSCEKSAAELQRREALFEAGALAQEELDRYRVAAQLDRQRLAAAEAQLALLREGSRPEAVAAARAEVERSRAVLKASEAQLADLRLTCPIDGVVLTRNYEPGEFVQAGAALLTIADLRDLWIKVYIPTDDLPRVRLGQAVRFSVSGGERDYAGTVVEIANRGEFTPKTIQTKKERTNVVFAVKIRVDEGHGVVKPGMPADVVFDGGAGSSDQG